MRIILCIPNRARAVCRSSLRRFVIYFLCALREFPVWNLSIVGTFRLAVAVRKQRNRCDYLCPAQWTNTFILLTSERRRSENKTAKKRVANERDKWHKVKPTDDGICHIRGCVLVCVCVCALSWTATTSPQLHYHKTQPEQRQIVAHWFCDLDRIRFDCARTLDIVKGGKRCASDRLLARTNLRWSRMTSLLFTIHSIKYIVASALLHSF